MTATLLRTPTRVINFAKIVPFSQMEPTLTLVATRPRSQGLHLVTAPPRTDVQVRRSAPKRPTRMRVLETGTLWVQRASGTISPIAGSSNLETIGAAELQLPYGMPRHVNVATLKRMLKAQRSDVLLKRNGTHWDIAEDSMQVDLLDDSVEFRLGSVQIFS